MREDLQRLLELQELDQEIHGLESEQAEFPRRREELAARRESADAAAATARATLQEAEAAQRHAEGQLQDREALVQKLEGQQFQVKSNDAYTALLREIEHARGAISDCETLILEAMEQIEAARGARERAEADARATNERVEAELRGLDERGAAVEGRLAELRGARGERCAGVPRELLEQYGKIGARHRRAVVAVRGEMCEGCRVNVPPQLQIELMRGDQVITCLNCRRILVPPR